MRTPEERAQKAQEIALRCEGELPETVWVEGDGTMWGQMHGNERQRIKIDQLQAVMMIHKATMALRAVASV